jgi:methanogenic corrinoid protein MtbC1
MEMNELDNLVLLVVEGEDEKAVSLAESIIKDHNPSQVIDVLTEAMREMGDKFERGEIFLPELLIMSDALMAVMGVIEPHLNSDKKQQQITVVLGTVFGDVHEIGKNIVGIVLKANGYNVIDLGASVSADEFINKAEENQAQVIGMSSLMTTTMSQQKVVIDTLIKKDLRHKYKVIVGGAPISKKWAEKIGADGYAEDAFKAFKLLKTLL